MENILWYKNGTDNWMEGLPLGNGIIAAMIYGRKNDIIALNHEKLWRGVNRNRDNEKVNPKILDEVRNLLKKGDFFKATGVANAFYGGLGGISKYKNRVDPYQPAGEIHFDFSENSEVTHRELDIMCGVAKITHSIAEKQVVFTSFCNFNEKNIILKWESENKFDGKLYFKRVTDENASEKCEYFEDKIIYNCSFIGGICYQVRIDIKTDGEKTADDSGIAINDATCITAMVTIGIGKEAEVYNMTQSYEVMLKKHKERFSDVYNRFSLQIANQENADPVDKRIKRVRKGESDEGILMLFFNYGRYLMISSSFNSDLPANLQGIWNNEINPPWESDYHFDINLQMNYWMCESVNLSECSQTLIKFVESMVPHAKKTAKDLYNVNGILFPLVTDGWGKSTPEAYGWAVWIGAAPWIAQNLWMRWIYSGDKEFLKNHAYPFFKGIAQFYEEYLVNDENGIYQIMPSQSPENRFEGTGYFPVSIGISSAMDVQLCYDALGYAQRSAEILNADTDEIEKWKNIRNALPEFKIGKDGRLLEWETERCEVEPGHRHLSHLYGLYPSDLFNEEERPQQYEAAKKSLESRMKEGGGHTGWSRAWVACLYARLGQGDKLRFHICEMIKEFATISLLDLHPPGIFQIEGNFGAVAAVIAAIADFYAGKLHLLRALPKEWNSGKIKGLKVPGGHMVNFEWEKGVVKNLEITMGYSERLIISADHGFAFSDDKILNFERKQGSKINYGK